MNTTGECSLVGVNYPPFFMGTLVVTFFKRKNIIKLKIMYKLC